MSKSTPEKKKTKESPRRVGAPLGPRKADDRRATLIEAAKKLFVEKGFEATTMNEVAQEAGFAKGTLYHYFTNKAELLQVLREKFEEGVMASIRAQVDACHADDWSGRIKAWIDGATSGYFDLIALHDVVIYGMNRPFRYAMADSKITTYLAALIGDGAKAGAWEVEDEQWIAVVMFYSFRGGCDEAIMGAQRPEDVPEKLFAVFQRILGIRDKR